MKLYILLCILYFLYRFSLSASHTYTDLSEDTRQNIKVLLKCLPCLFLTIWFRVFSHKGRCLSLQQKQKYQMISNAFLLSSIGDFALAVDVKGSFEIGISSFGFAQLCFIKCFGWQMINYSLAVVLYAIASLKILAIFGTHAGREDALQGLEFMVITAAVYLYCCLIYTTFWRALELRKASSDRFVDNIRALGVALFIISDTIIAVNKYCFEVPHSWIPIMGYYYLAQGMIAYSEHKSVSIAVPQGKAE